MTELEELQARCIDAWFNNHGTQPKERTIRSRFGTAEACKSFLKCYEKIFNIKT